jgi:hypothetical protein
VDLGQVPAPDRGSTAALLPRKYVSGFESALADPVQLNTILIRSGWYQELSHGLDAVNLSFTESMPLAGALVGLPGVIFHRHRTREFSPIHASDASW